MGANFCHSCGTKAKSDQRFCKNCGTRVDFEVGKRSSVSSLIGTHDGKPQPAHESLYESSFRTGIENQPAVTQIGENTQQRKHITILIVGILVLLIFIGIIVKATGHSNSYKIGYQAGQQLSAANSFFYLDGQPVDICNMTVTTAQAGTPNDNIDWPSINVDEFNQGCLDAYADTHDGLRTKTIVTASNSDNSNNPTGSLTSAPSSTPSSATNSDINPSPVGTDATGSIGDGNTSTPSKSDATGSIGN